MLLSEIKIFPAFWETQPSDGKMEEKRQYLKENGAFQSDIVVDDAGYLLDGFTSYLLARECGLMDVPVRHGKRQVIQAYHRQGGKLYFWELPEEMVDQVSVGDKVAVRTRRGVRRVTVAAVGEYRFHGADRRLGMAICRRRRDAVCQQG